MVTRGKQQRKAIKKSTRLKIYARDNGVCVLCGKHVDYEDLCLDHIVPVMLGGTNEDSNLRTAHRQCNLTRGPHPGYRKIQYKVVTVFMYPSILRTAQELTLKYGISIDTLLTALIYEEGMHPRIRNGAWM